MQAPSSGRDLPDSSLHPHPRRAIPASWGARTKLQVAVGASLQPADPSGLWTSGEMLCLLPQRRSHPEIIERAGYAMPALLKDVSVDHGGGQVVMPSRA